MTTSPTGAASNHSDNFCYRHPSRLSYVLCQRCARTICPECQTQAPVGVSCPECLREQQGRVQGQQRMHAQQRRQAAGGRVGQLRQRLLGSGSPATYTLMALIAVVGILQWITRMSGSGFIDQYGSYSPQFTDLQHYYPNGQLAFEPWRMLTAAFLHSSFLHFAMNTLTLWIFGRALEPIIGPLRFAMLYLVSGLGGSLAVALLAPGSWVIGASGAVFGLFGAWFLVLRKRGQDLTSMLVLIGINVALSFINPGVSWQAHLGGLVIGFLCGWLTMLDLERGRKRPGRIKNGRRTLPVLGLWLQVLVGVCCIAVPPLVGTLL
jgi:membrane associated rhomboid family serine protease